MWQFRRKTPLTGQKLRFWRLLAALISGIALLTLTASSASAVSHSRHRATGTPEAGGITCSFSAKLKFSPALTASSTGAGTRTVVKGLASGCKTSADPCCVSTGYPTPQISKGNLQALYERSPLDCATHSALQGPLVGNMELEWLGYDWQPTQVNLGVSTGSFPGGATVAFNAPSGLASLCASPKGIRAITVTGTVTMGPNCGAGVAPFTMYQLGSGPVCGSFYNPRTIVAGPDGALWFTMPSRTIGGPSYIARISTSGAVTTFTVPGLYPNSLTVGPDGALWFTSQANLLQVNSKTQVVWGGAVGRMTTSGAITSFPVSGSPGAITLGPDGALWFLDSDSIDRITTSGVITSFPSGGSPLSLTTGPDGALWFVDSSEWVGAGTKHVSDVGGAIGRMTTSGVVTTYGAGSIYGENIAPGPDGALWFTEFSSVCSDCLGRITTSGVLSTYTNPELPSPSDLTIGPDGGLWFTGSRTTAQYVSSSGSIGEITAGGQVDVYTSPGVYLASPGSITAGPDGAMWFTSEGNDAIGRVAVP
jgi:virginiamycin B lyase